MLLLDSFTVDHTLMTAPSVRLAKVMKTPHEDIITVFDLRFCRPNIDTLSVRAIHTLEHLLARFIRNHLLSKSIEVIDVSPMGCRTGFYMSIIGVIDEKFVINVWKMAMKDVLAVQYQNQILEINKYQCGNYKLHSLAEAKKIANNILAKEIKINRNNEIKLTIDKLKELNYKI